MNLFFIYFNKLINTVNITKIVDVGSQRDPLRSTHFEERLNVIINFHNSFI